VRLTRKSGVGPYATITRGFRRISAINVVLSIATLTSATPVYQASTLAFGGGILCAAASHSRWDSR
jgi:hypothetical protein